jgi:hypothetical protein
LLARSSGDHAAQLLKEVRELRSEVSRAALDGSRPGAIQSARRAYDEALGRLAIAERRLHEELGEAGSRLTRIRIADIQASIDHDTALLDIVFGESPDGSRRYLMFVVRSEGPVGVPDLGVGEDVDNDIRTLTGLVGGPSPLT